MDMLTILIVANMLIILIVAIISQCIHLSIHHIVHCVYKLFLFVNRTSIKLEGIKKKEILYEISKEKRNWGIGDREELRLPRYSLNMVLVLETDTYVKNQNINKLQSKVKLSNNWRKIENIWENKSSNTTIKVINI